MKIGIVLYPTFGGSGVVATELGKALAQKNHEVHFITYSQPVRLGSFRENIFYHEVVVADYPLFDFQPYEIALTSKLVDVVKYEKLDILHVHYAIPHASAAFMAKKILESQKISIPFVTTLHGTDITLVGRDQSFEPVITFCINQSDAVTTVSESLKRDTYKYFKVDREISVISNFIVESSVSFDQNLRRRYVEDDEKIVCHVSNFRKVKRIDDVIQIFAKIQASIPSKLILIGDGPERYKAEQTSRALGINKNVIFLGKLRNTDQVLSISDLFLLPSETESFGLAALEAMAVGVPVVSTNTGGIPEVNLDGFSGFTSSVGDVDSMAKNALKILKKENLEIFKANARERAALFSIERVLPKYEEIYSKLVKKVKE